MFQSEEIPPALIAMAEQYCKTYGIGNQNELNFKTLLEFAKAMADQVNKGQQNQWIHKNLTYNSISFVLLIYLWITSQNKM